MKNGSDRRDAFELFQFANLNAFLLVLAQISWMAMLLTLATRSGGGGPGGAGDAGG